MGLPRPSCDMNHVIETEIKVVLFRCLFFLVLFCLHDCLVCFILSDAQKDRLIKERDPSGLSQSTE